MLSRALKWAGIAILSGFAWLAASAADPPDRPAILEDTGAVTTIAQAVQSAGWRTPPVNRSLGFNNSPVWFRWSVPDEGSEVVVIHNTWLDNFTLYFVAGTTVVRAYTSGSDQPVANRAAAHPEFVFPVPEHPQPLDVYVLDSDSTAAALYPLTFMTWAGLVSHSSQLHLLHGIYFGIVLIMLIYNTVIFFTVRDRAYLYLVFYAGAQMLLMASSDGFGQLYLWNGLPWLQQTLPPLGLAGLQVFLAQFCIHFLHTSKHLPRLTAALRVFQIVAAVNGIGLAVYDNAIGAILLAIAVIRSFRGDRAAQVFLAANGFMCLFGINVAFTYLGWVPDTPIGRHGALLGSAMEIALLSFALAWRLKNQERLRSLLEEQSDALVHRVQELKAASSLAEHHRKLQRAVQHQQKLKTIGEMAGGVAHDFNNILAAILGYAELALDKHALTNPDKRTRYVEEIHKAGKRGADLVRQLITYSRGEQKTAEEIDLHLAVEETVTLLRASLPATVTIETHFPQQRIRTVLDPSQLQQVLVNLSLNACEAMTNRGKIKLTLSERHVDSLQCSSCLQRFSGRFAYICLEDDGVGIQCQAHELFTPFRTTKPVGQGSGLGLSVVHGIVHDYGGHVYIGNRTRGGCRAAIFLPLDPENVNKEISAQRILLIEEDASAAVHMETLLQAQAYAVTAVHQPAEALEKLLADPDGYDLVITNRSLPAGGMDFARELLDLCPDLPIIVTTGNSEDLQEAEETRMTAIVGKPIESDLLLAEVRHLLEPV